MATFSGPAYLVFYFFFVKNISFYFFVDFFLDLRTSIHNSVLCVYAYADQAAPTNTAPD